MSDRRSIFETSPWLASRILASCNCVIRLGFTQLIERHRPQTLLEPPLDSPLPLSRHCFQQFTKISSGRYVVPSFSMSSKCLNAEWVIRTLTGSLCRRPRLVAIYADLFLAAARAGNVV